MRKIPVTSRYNGLVYAIVDDEDFSMLAGYSWYMREREGKGKAVETRISYRQLDGKQKTKQVTMHHAIVGHPPIDMDVHHINGDVLDNQKHNLEVIDHVHHGHISSRQDLE